MRTGIASLMLAAALLPSLACAQTAPLSPPSFTPAMARAITAAARAEVHSGSTPGLAIGVVENGLLVYAHGFGYADLRPKRLAGADTEFYAGSLAKQFTAASVLLLAQQKKLSLNDPVTKFLPQLSIANKVTLRDLLVETSGLPRIDGAAGVPHDLARPVKIASLLSAVNRLKLQFAPGTRFDDNKLNYLIAGLVVQRVSGVPLSVFCSTQIFQPLLMRSTFLAGDTGISSAAAAGYTRAHGKFEPVRLWDASWLFGSSGLVTTVRDLAKWDVGLPLLLHVDSVREMWTPNGLPNAVPFGMGWIVDRRGGRRYVWESGRLPGYHAMNALLPGQHVAVIVLTNANSPGGQTTVQPERLANRILDVVTPAAQARVGNAITQRAGEWLGRLARIDIDRTQLTRSFSQYLSDQVVERADFAAYGPVLSLVPAESYRRSKDTVYVFDVRFRRGEFRFDFALTPNGKINGMFLQPYG